MELNHKSWEKRWDAETPGFHQAAVNAELRTHTDWLVGDRPSGVYVPLCGASIDLDWLATHFDAVVGTELIPAAVERFFRERKQAPAVEIHGDHRRLSAGNVTIIEGDALSVKREMLGPISSWYDRAAMIALRPELRRIYVDALRRLLPAGARGLLITLSYDQTIASGPPWSVSEEEVLDSYRDWCIIEKVQSSAAERVPSKFEGNQVIEATYRLVRTEKV